MSKTFRQYKDKKNKAHVSVSLNYTHIGGGSNGCDLDINMIQESYGLQEYRRY